MILPYYLRNLGMGGGGIVGPPFACFVDPLSVQADLTASDAIFGSINPLAVRADSAATAARTLTIIVRGFISGLLVTRGYGPVSGIFGDINPQAVQIDQTASNATFGNVDPFAVK